MSTYPTYKPAGIEWLGDIPEHWEVKRLKNVTQIVNGSTPKSNIEVFWDGDITWVTPGDISKLTGYISSSEKTITEEGYNSCGTELVPPLSTILTCRAPIGNTVIAETELCTNQGCKSLFSNSVEYRYLYYFILSANEELNSLGQGTTFLELSRTSLGDTKLSFPKSQDEQTAIANYLDEKTTKLDQLISNKKDQIDKLKEVRQIEINTAVTKGLDPNVKLKPSGIELLGDIPEHWELWKLSSKFKDISSGTTPQAGNDRFYENGEYPWINTGDLNDSFLHSCKKKVTQTALDEHSVLKLHPPGVLIMAMYGATIGKLGIISFEACCNQACCVIGTSKSVETKYLFYWLMGNRTEIVNRAYGGGQPNISQDVIKRLRITCPPSKEQTAIANYLDEKTSKIDQLVSNLENQIEQLEEVIKIEIYNAVTGKIKTD